MSPRRRVLTALAAALVSGAPKPFAAARGANALSVEGPSGLQLDDGRTAKLLGYVVPGDLSPTPTERSRVAAVRARLSELLAHKIVLEPLGEDRLGRLEVLARTEDGRLVPELILEEGLAWAWPDGVDAAIARVLLAAEARARAARRGLWADAELGEQDARGIAPEPIRFVVAVGTVVRSGQSARFLYLDLGPERRRDLVVRVPAAALPAFRRMGLRAERLLGRRLRVRGWLFPAPGPTIEIDDPLSLEVVE